VSERDRYQPGVPCWVDILVPDPARALDFYGQLFGWKFAGPGPGDYYEARLRDRSVAGVGAAPEGVPAVWNTYVSVASADDAAQLAVRAGARLLVEPLEALPAGRLAVVEDPTGAAVGLWEPAGRHGCQLVNEASAYTMSMLQTNEPDASARFYREVFGWATDAFAPGISLFRLPDYVGGEPSQPVPRDVVAVMAAADDAAPARWSVGFWVSDADAAASRAPKLGGSVIVPPFDSVPTRQTVLADPFGAAFSVSTAPAP
jgi:uncharacterized protein